MMFLFILAVFTVWFMIPSDYDASREKKIAVMYDESNDVMVTVDYANGDLSAYKTWTYVGDL